MNRFFQKDMSCPVNPRLRSGFSHHLCKYTAGHTGQNQVHLKKSADIPGAYPICSVRVQEAAKKIPTGMMLLRSGARAPGRCSDLANLSLNRLL